ncbi:Protein of unknown function DUF3405 [Penicillium sp. IBT 18751x]|nr:Protein of unknown function DUF3405 [Penicillium sp. IBT 18751x]
MHPFIHMPQELYPSLKAVYVPHPIYADGPGRWTVNEPARIYTPGSPETVNGTPDSAWNQGHLYNQIMYSLSLMSTTQFVEDLHGRWPGYFTAEHEGGR